MNLIEELAKQGYKEFQDAYPMYKYLTWEQLLERRKEMFRDDAKISALKDSLNDGANLIVKERERQLKEEKYGNEHDDAHDSGELALAASCYIYDYLSQPEQKNTVYYRNQAIIFWPWFSCYFKPTPEEPIRQLVKAGALIAAEIDRLLRKDGKQ